MRLTKQFGLELPVSKWADFLELEQKFFTKIKAYMQAENVPGYRGNFIKWTDTNTPITNTDTGNFWYPFPVNMGGQELKDFGDTLGLGAGKLAYLKANTKKLDKEDQTWFPDDD